MEGMIARWYARNTARDEGRFQAACRIVTSRVPAGGTVLEVAPGPGYLAIAMAKSGLRVTALDISASFIEMGRKNAERAGVSVDFRRGNASAMPFEGASFDYVVCMAAFKNFADPIGALHEMHRVLKPGGQASILDLRKDAAWPDVEAEVSRMGLTDWNALLTRWTFRGLLKRAYSREAVERMAGASGFGSWEVRAEGIGFELRLLK
jgi:ubiquinone/menaquinone biosynthesis C-methylase UbiE